MATNEDDELLSADAILDHAGAGPTRRVKVPAWKGSVLVRGMTMRELEFHQNATKDAGDKGVVNATLIQKCAVTPAGSRIFLPDHISRIADLGVRELEPIVEAILTLSGLNDEGADEILGKSETTSTDNPSSESPGTSDAPSESFPTD